MATSRRLVAGRTIIHVADEAFDPERGSAAAEKLRALGVRGVLLKAAEQGRITQVVCKMQECYCPEELGGACYFEPRATPQTDWMPTPDHYPILKMNGGHLTVDNIRLAHRLCNRIDYSKQIGRPHAKDLAPSGRQRSRISFPDESRCTNHQIEIFVDSAR